MGEAMTMPSIEQIPALEIQYFPDTDTLVFRASGLPSGPNGETVARNLYAFTDNDGYVNGVTLEHASEVLPSYCLDLLQSQPKESMEPTAS
jgi:uncharacterized protein YuzE